MLPVLDPAQLTRIHATHRGFLYQHVYAVALLLAAPQRGTLKVRVERDQDIEVVRGDATLYIQVRTRLDRSLMPSDIAGVLSDFEAIRVAHATGARAGLARFAIVSNATAGPALVREIADWPADVVFLAGDTSESGTLVRAPATVEALLDECVRLAGGYVLSTLRPETLVWKLAAIVSAACADEGPAREFDVDALPALCEMAAAELHALPRVENYLAQRGEPDAAALPRVSMVLGHSGAGKSAWASQAATHGGDVVVYFRCADLPDDQLAPRFVREAVGRIAMRRGVPPLCQRSCRTAGAEPVGLNTNGGEQSTAT